MAPWEGWIGREGADGCAAISSLNCWGRCRTMVVRNLALDLMGYS